MKQNLVRFAWYAVLLFAVVVVALAGSPAGKVQDVEDNGPTSQLPRGAQATQVEEELPAFDASGILPVVVVVARDGGLTDADRGWLEGLGSEVAAWSAGPSDIVDADDGAAATLTYPVDTLVDDWPDRIVDTRDLLAGAPAGLVGHVTGPAAAAYDGFSVFDGLDTRILLASMLVVAGLLLLTYRSPVLWLLPLVAIGVAMTMSQAVIYLLGEHADVPVNGMSGGFLPILVFGVGTDYALLLVARYREQLHEIPDRHVAMAVALRRSAPAVVASAATVVLGMLCLLLADINSTRSLGAVAAIGIACASVSMLTVLPALLVLVGRRGFWPYVPHVGDADREARRSRRSERRWSRVAGLATRSPRRVWLGSAAALGVLAVMASGLDFGPDEAERFRDAPDSVVGQQVLADHFPAGDASPVEIVADAGTETVVREAAAGVPGIDRVSDPRASADGSRVLISAVLADPPDGAEARATVGDLRTTLAEVPTAAAAVGGWTAQQVDIADASRCRLGPDCGAERCKCREP